MRVLISLARCALFLLVLVLLAPAPDRGADAQVRGVCVSNCGSPGPGPGAPPPVDLSTKFHLRAIESRGDFYIVTSDGRRLAGSDAVNVPLDNGARMITGPTGHARIILPDETTFTVGPNAEIVLDDFVYDPNTTIKKTSIAVVKGAFRWVTGKVAKRNLQEMRVKTPIGTIGGIRGTDFEVNVEPGGSGYIALYEGQIELTEYDTGNVIVLTPGQTIRFENFKITSR